ncbi:MAG: DUF58 domain-containing protein [Bacteroidota bacterium]
MSLDADLLNQIAPLRIKAAQLVDSIPSGIHSSRRTGQSLDLSDLRSYQPGDDLRHIDWRASGKRDRYYVRRFTGEQQLRVCLLLDMSSSMAFRYRESWSKEFVAVHLSAVLSQLFLSQGDAVGLVLYDEKIVEQISPLHTPAHEQRLFNRLDRLLTNSRSGPARTASLPELIHQLQSSIPRVGHWIVLSDLLGENPESEEFLRTVRSFRAMDCEVTFFQILERASEVQFRFDEEEILFEDLETGEQMDTGESYWKKESRRQARIRQERWRSVMQKSDAGWVEVDTASPLLNPLYQWIDQRRVHRGPG